MGESISNEQLFEFMTKMYGDMQEGFKEVNSRIGNVEKEVKETRDKVTVIEQEHGKKLDVLFDGYKQTYEKLTDLEEKVDEINLKDERQDVEIKVIRSS